MELPLLYTLFIALRSQGLALGTRDYLEGVEAFGVYRSRFMDLNNKIEKAMNDDSPDLNYAGTVLRTRLAITWICQVLWARTESEKQEIHHVVNNVIGSYDNAVLIEFLDSFGGSFVSQNCRGQQEHAFTEAEPTKPPSDHQMSFRVENTSDQNNISGEHLSRSNNQSTTDANKAQSGQKNANGSDQIGVATDDQSVSFSDRSTALSYFEIPDFKQTTLEIKKQFNWHLPSEISQLEMLSLWRRLYKPTKKKDYSNIDIAKTVEMFCHSGLMLEPQMEDRTQNTAELLVLIDAGDYMSPWLPMSQQLGETAQSKLSRLKECNVYYFNKMPGQYLYQDRQFKRRVKFDSIFQQAPNAATLVFSESGSAQQVFDVIRKVRLHSLINNSFFMSGRKIAWLNPMPRSQWLPDFLQMVSEHHSIHLAGLSLADLTQSMDFLKA